MSKKTTVKVSGTKEQINDFIDVLPQKAIHKLHGKMADNTTVDRYHQFVKLNSKLIHEIAVVEREVYPTLTTKTED